MVENPLVSNIEHAIELVDLSRLYSVNIMVGHVLLFHTAIQKVKELIKEFNQKIKDLSAELKRLSQQK